MDTFQELSDIAADRIAPATETPAAASEAAGDRVPEATDPADGIPVIGTPVAPPSGWSDPQTNTDGPRY